MAYSEVEIGLPARLERRRGPDGMQIVRKWMGWQSLFFTVFAVFWDGFMVVWYTQAAEKGDQGAMLFGLGHVAVGVGVTYFAIATWFNSTVVTFNKQKVSVTNGPLPWPGNSEIKARTLKQLYSKEHISRSRNGTSVTYSVHAITTDSRTIKVLGGLENSDQALYIEQELENFLGIEDKPVRGEISR